ncbi:unnamed protein product, partial [Mesorhabditis belari]|uniref:VOC domain-containing protein n=1 Tax=Mesorhabditis belari TaxID=2138241 RepID=A0AAF3F808_9BILA
MVHPLHTKTPGRHPWGRPVRKRAWQGLRKELLPRLISIKGHVSLAARKKTAKFYKDLDAKVSATVPLPEHGVYTVFVELPPDTKLELLLPLGDKSPIQAFLNKNKSGGMHHICIG